MSFVCIFSFIGDVLTLVLDTCYWKFPCMYTHFCLKNLCSHRVRFEIGSYSLCSVFCYFISMCLVLIFVHLQVVAGMSAMLDVFVADINVA